MSSNIHQIFLSHPTTVFAASDLMYLGRSPYSATDDFAFTYSSLIPVNTKGDLFTWASAAVKLPVGGDGSILMADSAAGTGLRWTAVTFPATVSINSILVTNAANVFTEINAGSNQILSSSVLGAISFTSSLPASVQNNITSVGVIASGTWQGTAVGPVYGGTGLSSYLTGDTIYASGTNVLTKLSGNTTSTKMYLSQTGTGVISAAPAWSSISGTEVTGAALTKTDDTNVTLTLGGTPATALLRAASITAGWSGQLSLARGGTNANLTAANGAIPYSTASAFALLAHPGTTNLPLLSSSSGAPHYSNVLFPDNVAINSLLVTNTANILSALTSGNNCVVQSDGTGVISFNTQLAVAAGGTGTGTAFTTGSVVFAGASGVYSQNNSNFFWNNSTIRLGIGTASPNASFHTTAGAIVQTGLTVGFNTTPSAGVIFIGDALFKLDYGSGTPNIFFDASGPDYFQYNRSTDTFRWVVGNVQKAMLNSLGEFVVTSKIGIGVTTPSQALDVNGIVNVSDTTKTYPAGLSTESAASLINYGINDSRFGTQTNANQGGFLRFDARAANNSLTFFLRAATDTGVNAGPYMNAAVGGRINFALSNNSLFTTDTDGFPYIPTCAGTPTGVPTTLTGLVPHVYDSTNNKLYIYNGAWRSVTLA